ncbi:MAG: hypothetical protein HFH23_02760 [Ruminococcus sp.]|jgi:hypothetical protein|uniref:hypothetical protein n=1 Tax=uncultured Adlercreutzia sp. TaxID=875803 RepID=UPI00272E52DA|nr:hypothetical protein [uncultured Adlercreutzia sp.]MCI8711203.1 hypothetical protein [Ruminococcus sp.]
MAKTSRTYRLSGNALSAIEERDRNLYPTASDFVEGMLVKERDERKAGEIMEALADIRREVADVRRMLSEQGQIPSIPEFR